MKKRMEDVKENKDIDYQKNVAKERIRSSFDLIVTDRKKHALKVP